MRSCYAYSRLEFDCSEDLLGAQGPHLPPTTLLNYGAGTSRSAGMHYVGDAHATCNPREDPLHGFFAPLPSTAMRNLGVYARSIRRQAHLSQVFPCSSARELPALVYKSRPRMGLIDFFRRWVLLTMHRELKSLRRPYRTHHLNHIARGTHCGNRGPSSRSKACLVPDSHTNKRSRVSQHHFTLVLIGPWSS
ncbi:hypothetical protein BC834DRAFT_641707 [Gloeopeniophorella convolvens]|nr:hypothetical protein BC834DRAFT_641707 [Gloeopeniophorella convolvens]